MRFLRFFLLIGTAAASSIATARASGGDASAPGAQWSNERSEVELQRFLNRWLRAQNSRDFDGYLALYAPQFEVTRSPGTQIVRLDRAGWEREQRTRFATPMQVRLFFVETVPSGDSPELSFVRLVTAGGSEEITATRMGLQRSGDRLLVSSERVLAMRTLPGKNLPSAPQYFRFAEDRAVLWQGNVAPAWLPQAMEVKRTKSSDPAALEVQVEARVPWKSLPEALAAWETRTVQVLSASDAAACHLGVPVVWKHWSGPSSLVDSGRDEDIVRFLLEDEVEDWTLGAPASQCGITGSAVFARIAEGATPPTAAAHPAPRALAAEAMAAFKKVPQWAAVSHGGRGSAKTVQFELPSAAGRMRLVAMSYESAVAGCGAWALWKVRAEGAQQRLELLNDPGDLTYFYPEVAADIDGDGKPELFGGSITGGEGLGFVDRVWSASRLRPVDGTAWIPWERNHCEE